MKKTASIFNSTLGVLAMFLLLVAVCFLGGRFKHRFDLTAEKAFTLSPGTKAILAKLDTPVQIRFYCTQGENAMPVFLKTYAQRVEDLLGEFKRCSKFIEVQKLDPQPDSDAEDSARLDGVEGQMLQEDGERLYLGLSVSMLDQKQALPFLSPDRERLLEYDLARAVSRVAVAEKPVVGIMSPLQIAGMPMNPMMMQMQQRQGMQPWAIYSELKSGFTLKKVEMGAESIPEDVKVLVLVHPKEISETTQYALDQFVLRGGKLIAFLDPLCALDSSNSNPMMGMAPPSSSANLATLLKAWGVSFDNTKVVADMNYIGRSRKGREPGVLLLTEKAVNKDDAVTADAPNLLMAFAGRFSGTPAPGLTETVLIKSSKNSQLVEPMLAQMNGDGIAKDFKASDTEYPLAIRLSGKFKTAFPEGKPKSSSDSETKENKDNPANKVNPVNNSLKESKQETSVVLIGDCDMIQDPLCVTESQNPFTGQRIAMPANSNLAFAQGLIEQMSGDTNLLAVRGRSVREHPFLVEKQMQAEAESKYRSKIHDLEQSLQDAQTKLNELQVKKENGQQKFILSPEQQQALASFRTKQAEVKKELKEVRRSLRADIDSLENRIKWINIAGMPFLVALSGLGLAAIKRKRSAAK
jgi:ABC-type uncharacterized transport system involved in gliding motility auxiliary subunit